MASFIISVTMRLFTPGESSRSGASKRARSSSEIISLSLFSPTTRCISVKDSVLSCPSSNSRCSGIIVLLLCRVHWLLRREISSRALSVYCLLSIFLKSLKREKVFGSGRFNFFINNNCAKVAVSVGVSRYFQMLIMNEVCRVMFF